MRRFVAKVSLLAFCFAAACGSPSTTAGPSRDRNVLMPDQLAEPRFRSAHDAVAALRPNWLTPRGPDSFTQPSVVVVYMDDIRLGGVETLETIDLKPVKYIRYYDAASATSRWGTGHASGAIYVSTRTMGGGAP